MKDEKNTTTETAAPEATPEEQANQETEAVKAIRDVYEARLQEKEKEISAIAGARAASPPSATTTGSAACRGNSRHH